MVVAENIGVRLSHGNLDSKLSLRRSWYGSNLADVGGIAQVMREQIPT